MTRSTQPTRACCRQALALSIWGPTTSIIGTIFGRSLDSSRQRPSSALREWIPKRKHFLREAGCCGRRSIAVWTAHGTVAVISPAFPPRPNAAWMLERLVR